MGIFIGGNFHRWQFSGRQFSVGQFFSGQFSVGQFSRSRIIATFFRAVLTSCNLVPAASFLFDVNVKKYKDAGAEFGRNTFECGLFEKSTS